ncbi:MAG: protease inhibitor I42 family protein [Clostridia bacterium]|nr:protease inhibitor I42 family protein [Clostridia bacterium]
MKKIISILMSVIILMGLYVTANAENATAPEIVLTAPYQYYTSGEEITFDVSIRADKVYTLDYAKLFIDCNKDVLKFEREIEYSDNLRTEFTLSETETGYVITFVFKDFEKSDVIISFESFVFSVSEGDPAVTTSAVLKYKNEKERKAVLVSELPVNDVFEADEIPHLVLSGDLELFRKDGVIYLPFSIRKSDLINRISSSVDDYKVTYKTVFNKECGYALTNDELYIEFNGSVSERVRICILGDADYNGIVNAADARKTLRYAAKLESFPEHFSEGCDFNGNLIPEASDARKILRISAKLDSFMPVEVKASVNVPYEFGTLVSLSDAGYLWRCTVSDENAFDITEDSRPSVDNTGKPPEEIIDGASELQMFTLTPKKTGVYKITFEHARPWNNEMLEKFSFVMIVN